MDSGAPHGLVCPSVPGKHRFHVRTGDEEIVTTVSSVAPGAFLVDADGRTFEVLARGDGAFLVRDPEENTQWTVDLDPAHLPTEASCLGVATPLTVLTPQALAAEAAAGGPGSGAKGGSLTAPMPGRIVQVVAEPGVAVEAGAPLIVMEAMKMENELAAPAAGVVSRVHVAPGDAVEAGALLCELTPPEG